MRFAPISCLRDGMVLGKTLYGVNNQVMLTAGSVLTKSYIHKISLLRYNGLYVEDYLSKDLPVVNFISDELKQKTVKGIKGIFIDNTLSQSQSQITKAKNMQETKMLVENIVDEILNNKNLMVNMIDLKVFDEYTFYHSVNVTVLSIVVGVALRLPKEQLYKLGLAALMHDIGKVFIPKEILNKPGKLEPEEFEVMKSHSEIGYRHVKEYYDLPITSYVGILQHHEKYDGTGYPEKRKGEGISLFGRIISICDVYDALTSDRPYRRGMLPSEAMEYIMGGGGSMFDPKLVMLFTKKIAPYPIGTCVKLSNNIIGIVIENYEDCCMRPKIQIYKENDMTVEPYIIDLVNTQYNGVTITEIVNE